MALCLSALGRFRAAQRNQPSGRGLHRCPREGRMQPCKAAFFNSVKVTQLCQNLCDPTDFTVCGILQARTLEWEAITFSRNFFPTGIIRIMVPLKPLILQTLSTALCRQGPCEGLFPPRSKLLVSGFGVICPRSKNTAMRRCNLCGLASLPALDFSLFSEKEETLRLKAPGIQRSRWQQARGGKWASWTPQGT